MSDSLASARAAWDALTDLVYHLRIEEGDGPRVQLAERLHAELTELIPELEKPVEARRMAARMATPRNRRT